MEYVRNIVARLIRSRIHSEFRHAPRYAPDSFGIMSRAEATFQNTFVISSRAERISSEFRRAPKYVSEYVRTFVARPDYVPEYVRNLVAHLDYVSDYVRNFVARRSTFQNTFGISSRAENQFRIRFRGRNYVWNTL